MTAEEAAAALARPEPRLPNRELVELDAITARGEAYRRLLDRAFRDEHGERPTRRKRPGRFPVSWRKPAPSNGTATTRRSTSRCRSASRTCAATRRMLASSGNRHGSRPKAITGSSMKHGPRDRWAAIQTTTPQEASMATPEQQRDDARARREAEARALADKQRKQAAEREQQQERGRDDPEIPR